MLESWNALNSHFPPGRPLELELGHWHQYGWITVEAARLHASYAG